MSPVPVAPTEREPHLQAFRARVGAGSEDPARVPEADPSGTPGSASLGAPEPDANRPGLPVAPEPDANGPGIASRPVIEEKPYDALLDRLAQLRGDPRAGLAAIALLALVAGFIWYRSALDTSPRLDGAGELVASEPAATTSVPAGPLVIHVSGAVGSPGVYTLTAGSRVTEAVAMAGGPVDGADLDRLNLAAPVADGQRVHVPKQGEPMPDGVGVPGAPGAPNAGPLDVNVANVEQLEQLPGVGPSIARAIIEERERHGPFRSVDDLVRVSGIGERRLEELRPHVTV